jgi:hypothetical protein
VIAEKVKSQNPHAPACRGQAKPAHAAPGTLFALWGIRNLSTVGPAETLSDNSDVRRPAQLVMLLVASFLSGTGVHGQTREEFIAGCAVGAFDSFSDLKANCPPRTQAQVIDVRPAFTSQQLDEMNKYAREGAAALQQYLNKQSISTVHPPMTRIDTTSSNTHKNQASDEVSVYQPSTLPSTPPTGGALTGVAKAASQYNQNASSRALVKAQRELYEAEREMAESTEFWKSVANKHAVIQAAGAPLVKEALTLAEAQALEKEMHLNPSQVHIFPADLEPFDSDGKMRMSHGMAVEYFRYTLVGDVDARANKDSVNVQGPRAISGSTPNAVEENANAENGDGTFSIYGHAEGPRKSEARKQKEAQEAYDRCTAIDDESHQNEIDAGRGGKENDRTWLRARAYCRVNLGEPLDKIMKDLNAAGLGR